MTPYRFVLSKPVRNDHLVRQTDHRRSRELRTGFISGGVLVLVGLFYGWQHFEFIQIGYRMEELRLEEENLRTLGRQLSLEHASLASPDRIENLATRRLGMRAPTRDEIFVLLRHAAPATGGGEGQP